MGRAMPSSFALGSAALLVVAMVGTSAAQSPSPVLPGAPATIPAASGAIAGGSPAATPVGPITWKRVTKGKDFSSNASVYQVAQLPDGRLIVVGTVGDASGRLTGAAWSSSDGKKWSRVKIKAPKGSIITAIERAGATIVATGDAGDGTGLLWTSADGSTWQWQVPP